MSPSSSSNWTSTSSSTSSTEDGYNMFVTPLTGFTERFFSARYVVELNLSCVEGALSVLMLCAPSGKKTILKAANMRNSATNNTDAAFHHILQLLKITFPSGKTARDDFLNTVYFRRGITCNPGLTNDLIDGGLLRFKPCPLKAKPNHVLKNVFKLRLATVYQFVG